MFKVKKWSSYQSYKDRNPPWVRLHKKTLDDYQFQKMSVESRALLPMLWLLAAEDDDPRSGMIRLGPEEIAYRLRRDPLVVKAAIDEIVRAGFIIRVDEDDVDLFNSKSTSYESVTPQLRNCHPETETETETEDNPKGLSIPKRQKAIECPSGVDKAVWSDFQHLRKQKRSPLTKTAMEGLQHEADKAGISLNEALKECCARGWQGFKADWFNKNAKGNYNDTGKGSGQSKSERARAAALRAVGADNE